MAGRCRNIAFTPTTLNERNRLVTTVVAVVFGAYRLDAMRGLAFHFVLLLFAFTSRSMAQAIPSLPEPDKDPFVGTWQANANKSRPKLDKVNASYVRTLSRDGDELVFSSRMKRAHSTGFSENHYRIRCDGLPHSVQCGEATCKSSCTYVSANRVEGDTEAFGKMLHWAREVSPDGQELTIYGYADKARKKIESVQVNDRVK